MSQRREIHVCNNFDKVTIRYSTNEVLTDSATLDRRIDKTKQVLNTCEKIREVIIMKHYKLTVGHGGYSFVEISGRFAPDDTIYVQNDKLSIEASSGDADSTYLDLKNKLTDFVEDMQSALNL